MSGSAAAGETSSRVHRRLRHAPQGSEIRVVPYRRHVPGRRIGQNIHARRQPIEVGADWMTIGPRQSKIHEMRSRYSRRIGHREDAQAAVRWYVEQTVAREFLRAV